MSLKYIDESGNVINVVAGGAGTIEDAPAASIFRVIYNVTWPARPTARTDVYIDWVGGTTEPPGMVAGDTWSPEQV